jgi:hypothetical protein
MKGLRIDNSHFTCRPQQAFYALKAVMLGLIISQAISTLHVYMSNIELYQITTAISKSGYLAIPNQQVVTNLKAMGPAFFGGLFFTLTAGACLSILSFASAWIWDRIFSRNKVFLILLVALWLGGLIAANSHGFNPTATSYFLFIPPVVFFVSFKWMPDPSEQKMRLKIIVPVISFIILVLLFSNLIDLNMFLSIRDNLLLSNPVGKKVNSFYYDYSLYAARVFKSMDQKILRTCDLSLIDDEKLAKRIENELLIRDYINIGKEVPVDLKIVKTENGLVLKNKDKTILKTTQKIFFRRPEKLLKKFSETNDNNIFFRRFTFFSLLFLSSVTLYCILYIPFYLISRFFIGSTSSSIVAGVLCCIIGLVLLFPARFEKEKHINTANLGKALESEDWHQRVAALKVVVHQRLEIGDFPVHTRMLISPHIPERYWLAKAMSVSRDPKTYNKLLELLDDPQFNVVYMAVYALGKRGNRKAINEIFKMIKRSDNWYNQWYAYRALRNLGWKQTKSK